MTTSMFIPRSGQGMNIKRESPIDDRGKKMLSDIGINYAILPREAKSVQLLILNRVYDGIGVYNKNGGMEFLSNQLTHDLYDLRSSVRDQALQKKHEELRRSIKTMRRPEQKRLRELLEQEDNALQCADTSLPISSTVTLNYPGVLFFPVRRNTKSEACCLFADFLDYLSYQQMLKSGQDKNLPSGCDCIVINHACNFIPAMLDSEEYNLIYCAFPNTAAGKVMEATVISRNIKRCKSLRNLYEGYRNLYGYIHQTQITSPAYENQM